MKAFSLIMIFALLTGCVRKYDGHLDASSSLSFKQKDEVVTVAAGNYPAQLRVKSKKRFDLWLWDAAGEKQKLKFKTVKPFYVPSNGSATILPSEWGQDYRIDISSRTDSERSQNHYRTERCTAYRQVNDCYRDQNGRRICRARDIRYEGHRRVEYYYLTEHQTLALNLTSEASGEGSFVVQDTRTSTIYSYRGPCRLY